MSPQREHGRKERYATRSAQNVPSILVRARYAMRALPRLGGLLGGTADQRGHGECRHTHRIGLRAESCYPGSMRFGPILLLICGCRIGFDEVELATTGPDGGGLDTAAACTWEPWSAPAPVEGFEGGDWERSPEQRSDRLEMLFARYEVVNGGVFNAQIRSATRATSAMPYAAAGVVVDLNDPSADDIEPTLSADGLLVMWSSSRTSGRRAFQVRRPALGAAFSTPVLALGLEARVIYAMDLTADGLGLYFDDASELWFSRRSARDRPFESPVPLGISGSGPSVSRDQLEIFYSRSFRLFSRRRASIDEAFADEVEIGIQGASNYGAADLSADGTELLLIVDDQLQRITRACSP